MTFSDILQFDNKNIGLTETLTKCRTEDLRVISSEINISLNICLFVTNTVTFSVGNIHFSKTNIKLLNKYTDFTGLLRTLFITVNKLQIYNNPNVLANP